jgi:hypothetical protein
VVADLKAAQFLRKMYPGASVQRLPESAEMLNGGLVSPRKGRPEKYTTEEKRKAAQRQQEKRSKWKAGLIGKNKDLITLGIFPCRTGVRTQDNSAGLDQETKPEFTTPRSEKTTSFAANLTRWDSRAAPARDQAGNTV